MHKLSIGALLLLFLFQQPLQAQEPQKMNTTEIFEQVQKLNFLGSVLYIAAHPDDENTKLISYLANSVKARTAYLSLTRGDGGQNLIGNERGEMLGVLRTEELLAARRIDGGEQFFSRANDFGYSKVPKETYQIWDKNDVLYDVVWAIRKFRPDVIINRFDHRTPGSTHGHHTASAELSYEAYDLASNPKAFPEQLKSVTVWQPKRLFFNTSWWFFGSEEKFEKANKDKFLTIDAGVYYPLKGKSNGEISALSRSQHRCQGFGTMGNRGSEKEYLEFLKGDFPKDKTNLFDGIDTSWNRVHGGAAIGKILSGIEANFNFKDPSQHIDQLLEAYKLIQKLDDDYWKTEKTLEIKKIILACSGLFLEANALQPSVSMGEQTIIATEVINRSEYPVQLAAITIVPTQNTIAKKQVLLQNKAVSDRINITIPEGIPSSNPYWLNETGTNGMYKVTNPELIGLPKTPEVLNAEFALDFKGFSLSFEKPIQYKYSDPEKGEQYEPFIVIPAVTASIVHDVTIFPDNTPKEIAVIVKAGKAGIQGTVALEVPKGWSVLQQDLPFEIAQKGAEKTIHFVVVPSETEGREIIRPIVTIGTTTYSKKLVEIKYDHIPKQTLLLPSQAYVTRLTIQKTGQQIGYIKGAGDEVPESLTQVGYRVTIINPATILEKELQKYDAIVLGVRALNVVEELKFKQGVLLDYVKKGGNLIVQYTTTGRNGFDMSQFAPYPIHISNDRVTDENSQISFIDATHPVLNHPNKITAQDFQYWVQERGLNFADEWASQFQPILSMKDEGESAKKGSLLIANYGKGHYIYTGLSFFRELPAGVPGAYRLLSNLIALKNNN